MRRLALATGLQCPMALLENDHGMFGFVMEGCEGFAEAPELEVVPHGLGAPKGLSMEEHMYWAIGQKQQILSQGPQISDSLESACRFECENEPEIIGMHREAVLKAWLTKAEELQWIQFAWTAAGPAEFRVVVGRLNGPFVDWLVNLIGFKDKTLVSCLQCGFTFAGDIEFGGEAATEIVDEICRPEVQDLWEQRTVINKQVMEALHLSGYGGDVHQETLADAAVGFMSSPKVLVMEEVFDVLLSQRLPVRETRMKKGPEIERVRVIDDGSASYLNYASRCKETIRCETVGVLLHILSVLVSSQRSPLMWKQDVSNAFRSMPILHIQLWMAVGTEMYQGKPMYAGHRGMPFGTVSAVMAWNRMAMLTSEVVRIWGKCPLARYVDDWCLCKLVSAGVHWLRDDKYSGELHRDSDGSQESGTQSCRDGGIWCKSSRQ